MGGHPIPKESVIRQHPRCFNNFWNLYRPIASDWYIIDNSGTEPKSIQTKNAFDVISIKEQLRFTNLFLKGLTHD